MFRYRCTHVIRRERVKTKLFTQNVRGIYSAKWSGHGGGGDKNMVAEKNR